MSGRSRLRSSTGSRVALPAGVAVGVLLTLAAFAANGGGVLSHTVCVSGDPLPSFKAWTPTVLANSPYGGKAWANATIPRGPFLTSPEAPNLYEIGQMNGSAAWAGFGGEFNVTAQENQSRLGPGSNSPCSTPFDIVPTFWGAIALGIALLGPGNTTDAFEPTTLGATIQPSTVELGISNGFHTANHNAISTCGLGAASGWANSSELTASIPISTEGSVTEESYAFPFSDAFHYWFPANFGTWQIDNLSAPGGPGGGWAFSYSPCS